MTEDKIKNSRPKKFSHRNTNNRYVFNIFLKSGTRHIGEMWKSYLRPLSSNEVSLYDLVGHHAQGYIELKDA